MSGTVHEAIAAVMAELPNIGKGDKSPQGYSYRGIEQVTKHVQPLFAKHGVVISPAATITSVVPSPAMKEGWQDVYMVVEWTITGPDGSKLTASTNGIGRDNSDKGANKAQTQAFKYLLLHLLCIADGKDDSDSQSYDHGRDERPKASKAQRDEVQAELESLHPTDKATLQAWWTEHGFGSLKRGTLLAAEVDPILDEIAALKGDRSSGDLPGSPEDSAGSVAVTSTDPALPLEGAET